MWYCFCQVFSADWLVSHVVLLCQVFSTDWLVSHVVLLLPSFFYRLANKSWWYCFCQVFTDWLVSQVVWFCQVCFTDWLVSQGSIAFALELFMDWLLKQGVWFCRSLLFIQIYSVLGDFFSPEFNLRNQTKPAILYFFIFLQVLA